MDRGVTHATFSELSNGTVVWSTQRYSSQAASHCGMAGSGRTLDALPIAARRDLPPLPDSAANAYATQTGAGAVVPTVCVRGRFIRKRKLSKGLVFGDIQLLDDGELLEVMIRAQEGVLDTAAIRQINWDVHLGDLVTAHGVLQRKRPEQDQSDGWLFVLHTIRVDELWSLHHNGAVFNHTASAHQPQHASTAVSTNAVEAVKGSILLPPASQADKTNKYTNMVTLDGFNACKYYFSSSGGANCLRGSQCHFWHGKPEDFAHNRQRWLAKRLAQRAQAAQLVGDAADPHAKLDKAQRGRIFCDWLVESLGEERLASGTGVVDVAGGKGDIPIQLWIRRGIVTTLIDPRPMKLAKCNRKLVAKAERAHGRVMNAQLLCCLDDETLELHAELFQNCSLLVGMHPDEATAAIVDAALALRKPFAVVPCCVMSRVFPDRRCRDGTSVDTYDTLVTYLKEKHPGIRSAFLPFAGRNQVLYLFDYDQEVGK